MSVPMRAKGDSQSEGVFQHEKCWLKKQTKLIIIIFIYFYFFNHQT